MSVAKLQVSLVRLVRSTMLESLPACLFMDFCELTKPDSSSQSQIETPLHVHVSLRVLVEPLGASFDDAVIKRATPRDLAGK